MTKKDIVLKITDMTGIKQVDVKKIVQKTFDVIVESLVRNEKVELRNFGVFKIKERRARFGRNPRTGESVPFHSCDRRRGFSVRRSGPGDLAQCLPARRSVR